MNFKTFEVLNYSTKIVKEPENLAFSKKQENHVGAIKHFICVYNQKIADDLEVQKK